MFRINPRQENGWRSKNTDNQILLYSQLFKANEKHTIDNDMFECITSQINNGSKEEEKRKALQFLYENLIYLIEEYFFLLVDH